MQDQDSTMSDNTTQTAKPPQLLAIELRVLGVLMEKQLTTPDQYPLTLNSVITACNQKSSRDPVTNYHQGEVLRCLNELEERYFVKKEYGSRSDKYSQQFISRLELGKKQQSVLCVMMLRGPQTLSELSTRTQRMQTFSSKEELVHCMERLCQRELPLAVQLDAAVQRGERYSHLFSGTPVAGTVRTSASRKESAHADDVLQSDKSLASGAPEKQMVPLQQQVQQLRDENKNLTQQLKKLYELTGHEFPGR